MTLIRLVARPMLASMFFVGAVNSLKDTEGAAKRAQPVADKITRAAHSVAPTLPIPKDPATLVRINAGTQILAGLGLATGRAPRLSAFTLAATLVPTTWAGHPFWREHDPVARSQQKTHFFKNVSMMGGVLLAGVDTAGRPGVAWRARHAATDVRRGAKHLTREAKQQAKLAAKSVG